jgi:hypothetical protein
MYKKIELAANVAIIVAALTLVGLAVNKFYFRAQAAEQAAPAGLKAGDKVALPDVEWARGGRTLVLALSTGCHFCTESAPFYQRLAAEVSKRDGARLIAVVPQTAEEGHKYLENLGVAINDVRQSPLNAFGVSGTPTLILVDEGGVAKRVWVGKLPEAAQADVIAQL